MFHKYSLEVNLVAQLVLLLHLWVEHHSRKEVVEHVKIPLTTEINTF